MSYILDALKKSQKQRRRGSVPDVLTVQEIVVQQPSGRRIWPVLAVCIAGLNVLLLIWFFGWRSQGPRNETITPGKSGPAAASPDIPVASPGLPARSNNDSVGMPRGPEGRPEPADLETDNAGRPMQAPERAARSVIPGADARGEGPPFAKDVPSKPTERPAEPLPAAENRIYRLQELPDQLRRILPEFAITALMYSGQPSSRMVRINGRLMREGEELPPGVRLQEVTPEGVILAYQGYRFSVAVK